MKEIKANECLYAALTLLIKLGALKESEVLEAISNGGFDAIMKMIDEKYKEVMSNQ